MREREPLACYNVCMIYRSLSSPLIDKLDTELFVACRPVGPRGAVRRPPGRVIKRGRVGPLIGRAGSSLAGRGTGGGGAEIGGAGGFSLEKLCFWCYRWKGGGGGGRRARRWVDDALMPPLLSLSLSLRPGRTIKRYQSCAYISQDIRRRADQSNGGVSLAKAGRGGGRRESAGGHLVQACIWWCCGGWGGGGLISND